VDTVLAHSDAQLSTHSTTVRQTTRDESHTGLIGARF
jgi:hypothetical protein